MVQISNFKENSKSKLSGVMEQNPLKKTELMSEKGADVKHGFLMRKLLVLPIAVVMLLQMITAKAIGTQDILYWVGTGSNQVIFVVNWCNPDHAFAWGYRFNTATVVVSDMMDSIAVVDPRFSYTASSGMVSEIFYAEDTLSLSLSGGYWMYNVNDVLAQFGYDAQTIVDGDIVMFGDELCAEIDEYWNFLWTTTIVPATPPMEFFDGIVGTEGCRAIHCNNSIFVAWATGCELTRGYQDIALQGLKASYGSAQDAIGKVTESTTDVVSLGDAGEAILTFKNPIINGEGYDFAVFENSFNDVFLELAFVEVSSDGNYWVRFPAISNTQTITQVNGNTGSIDARYIHNLAGKYRVGWGTPFDLEDLAGDPQLDLENIRYVKVIDVVGSINPLYASYDSRNRIINDPYSTYFASGGFDLAGVGVINEKSDVSVTDAEIMPYRIYPNPTRGQLRITSYELKDGDVIEIYNVVGQKLQSAPFNSPEGGKLPSFGGAGGGEMVIDISHFANGMYYLRIADKMVKIIKE